jgi:NAD-dependent dihydropyrimidine dehydrogenase PreA subunit
MSTEKLKDRIKDDKIRKRVEAEEALLGRTDWTSEELQSFGQLFPEGEGLITFPADASIAIDESIEGESVVLPSAILERLIKAASHRTIMNLCPCRDTMDCKDYPRESGCIFLGDAARLIDDELGRPATVEEALEYARKCRELGLIHRVGKFSADLNWLNEEVGPHTKLLTVCNCCPCCCGGRLLKAIDKASLDKISHKLPGVAVTVSEECTGCGLCEERCIYHAIRVVNGRAEVGEECRICGRCSDVCLEGALKVTVHDKDYVENAIAIISGKVDYT